MKLQVAKCRFPPIIHKPTWIHVVEFLPSSGAHNKSKKHIFYGFIIHGGIPNMIWLIWMLYGLACTEPKYFKQFRALSKGQKWKDENGFVMQLPSLTSFLETTFMQSYAHSTSVMNGWLLTSINCICIFNPWYVFMFLAGGIYCWLSLVQGNRWWDRQCVRGLRQALCRERY